MPLRFTPPEYLLARLNLLPTPLFDSPLAPGISKALVAACELDIFDTLGEGALSLDALATRLDCDPQGLQLLLSLLVSSGYLKYQRGSYRNSRRAKRWLTSSSRLNIAPYIIHSPDIIAIWDHLSSVARTGKQAMRMPYDDSGSDAVAADEATNSQQKVASERDAQREQFLVRHYAGLASLATALGSEIIDRIPLPATRGLTFMSIYGARQGKQAPLSLLDVGGSHAGYSVLFCRKYPNLSATILDIEEGIVAGQRTASQTKLVERMHFICCDIVRDDFPAQLPQLYDIALYFHIAHLLQPEVNRAVLEKVARSLKPGGVLAFVDQVTDQVHNSRLASLIVQFMALTMATVGGTCYPFPTVKSWLEELGFEQVRSHRLLTPGATLITAVKR